MTEEQIEARVELMTNALDGALMANTISQQEYDAQMRVLAWWADKEPRDGSRS